jgi:alkaline phosphatase
MVPVFAFGPGAESFMGIYDNHTIFAKFRKLMNFK